MGMLYLISGNEEFSVKERATELMCQLYGDIPEDNPELEVIRGDEDSEKFTLVLDRFLATLETPPFLSPKKTVWLKHFNKFDEALAEPSGKKQKSRIDLLSDFLKNGFPDDLTIVIDGAGLDRRKAFYKLCEKVCAATGGKLEWFEKVDPKAKGYEAMLHKRIREAVSNYNKRIDENGAAFLAETVGADAARLKNELEKLVSYVDEAPVITLEDCLQICSRNTETLSWEFSSALASKNAAKAISLIPGICETMEQERGSGARPEMAIVGAANSEFQRLLSAKCESERFRIPKNANADFFYSLFESQKGSGGRNSFFSMHPFRAYKIWENTMLFSDREISEAFEAIFEASKQMVTGGDPRLALENLVMNIAGR